MNQSNTTFNSALSYAILLVWGLSLVGLLFFVEQSSFISILVFYFGAFGSYVYLIRESSFPTSFNILLWSGIGIRILAIFSFPSLSDDIYRFIWDGRLSVQGYHPFEHLPAHYLELGNAVDGIDQALFEQLNSQEYYTIYPTISQWVFTFSAWLFPESAYGFSVSLKGILALMDIGSIFLFRQILNILNKNENNVLLYVLNPLVIVEICGNGHFEGGMIFFMALAFLFFLKERLILSALALSLAVASKMLPLIFLPLLLAVVPWRKACQYYLWTGLWTLMVFAPILSKNLIEHLGDSLNLYFQKFEFNASFYYIIRWIGFQVKGWNIIQTAGPRLAMLVFLAIWILTLSNRGSKRIEWPRLAMWSLTIYFLFATIVHPWYITTLVALCIFTNYRFPVVWSGLIVLTYINYSYPGYFENLWIVGLEYLLVLGMLIYEVKKYNFSKAAL